MKKIILGGITLALVLAPAAIALGSGNVNINFGGTTGSQLPTAPTGVVSESSLFSFINRIINFLFWALIVVAIIYVILAAFSYLTAGGDPEKVETANRRLLFAAVAVAIAVLAKGIPFLVCSLLGQGAACQQGQNVILNQP